MLCNCRCVYYLSPPAFVITIAWESHRPLEFSTDSHYRCSSSPPVFMTCVDHFPLAWRTPLGISLTASLLVRNYFLFVPLTMRVMLDEYFCSAYNYFLLAVWYIISFWCLASIISVEKSISLIGSPSRVICLFFFFSLEHFKISYVWFFKQVYSNLLQCVFLFIHPPWDSSGFLTLWLDIFDQFWKILSLTLQKSLTMNPTTWYSCFHLCAFMYRLFYMFYKTLQVIWS